MQEHYFIISLFFFHLKFVDKSSPVFWSMQA